MLESLPEKTDPNRYPLEHVERRDLDEVFSAIEKSFHIRFDEKEIDFANTFGLFCRLVQSKIVARHVDDSTKQQAFEKLRAAIIKVLHVDELQVLPDTLLADLFKYSGRKRNRLLLHKELDMELISWTGSIMGCIIIPIAFLLSVLAFFFSATVAIVGLLTTITVNWIFRKLYKRMHEKTVNDLTEIMVDYFYMKSRHTPGTVNREEVNDVIINLFSGILGVEREELFKEAKFGRL